MNQPRILERGLIGPDVEQWQRFLGIKADGFFGAETEQFTRMWQASKGILADGKVGNITRATAARVTTRPPPPPITGTPSAFIEAKNFTRGRYGSPVSLIVIHTIESAEKPGQARDTALWLAGKAMGIDGRPLPAPQVSAHFCVDSGTVVQCVRESDAAWAAPGANRNGIHIEHAGRASQTLQQWRDPYSEMMLKRSAALSADLCRRYNLPIKRLSAAEVLAGAAGICGHVDVSKAFKKSDHWDPGEFWPWSHYLDLVMAADGMSDKPHVS